MSDKTDTSGTDCGHVRNVSATERLRRMLDELRKQACDINEEEIRLHSVITLNQGRYNRQFRLDMNHEWLDAWHAEHERILQAIAATLGRGTCHDAAGKQMAFFACSECGATDERKKPMFCHGCGRKVVDDVLWTE